MGFRHDWGFRDERIAKVVRELEERNEVKMGDAFVVRIPKIEGKTSLRKGEYADYVEYKVEGWYDPEKKQNRNRKVIIGQVIYPIPGSMLPNENYYKYFDRVTGYEKMKGEEAEGTADHPGAATNTGDCPTVLFDRVTGYEKMKGEEAEGAEEEAEGTTDHPGAAMNIGDCPPVFSRREMIRNVMEEDGVIRRSTERMREVIREGSGSESEEEKKRRRRLRVLLDVLTSIRDVVKKQAQRRPDEVMNEYQVEKINPVLEEIIKIEKEMGLGDLLETIRKTETGKDGKVEVKGMSYGDIEVLLEYFNSVVWFTQSEML